ncbi:MAG TPA: CU044_2847 family protein [Puia sp.]|jgi:hypothetical protein|nr:CU044_2847 family protein [Puia sp.]
MKPILELTTGKGTILVQAQENEASLVEGTSRMDDVVVKISESIESKLEVLSDLAESITQSLYQKIKTAERIEVEFGISLTIKGTVYVVQSEAEATFKIKLICKPS